MRTGESEIGSRVSEKWTLWMTEWACQWENVCVCVRERERARRDRQFEKERQAGREGANMWEISAMPVQDHLPLLVHITSPLFGFHWPCVVISLLGPCRQESFWFRRNFMPRAPPACYCRDITAGRLPSSSLLWTWVDEMRELVCLSTPNALIPSRSALQVAASTRQNVIRRSAFYCTSGDDDGFYFWT